jgi:DNA-binding MarR family transcriptional regulator/GNAT superfamily N-acetyltransferase
MPPERTSLVRDFNRFYTRRLGLLGDGYLKTSYSLTQARLLYELAQHRTTSWKELLDQLGLDPGYLSRLLTALEKRHLLTRSHSRKDRRVSHLSLTAKGRREFAQLNSRSETEIAALLDPLSAAGQQRLLASMGAIRELLSPSPAPPPIAIRAHRPGDIGWVIARHGELYTQEYNWDSTFEGLVAEIAGKFLNHFDPRLEHCWIAERNGERLGCIFLVRQSKTVAKLRLLLVDPAARGTGLGTRLVDECLAFARRAGYRKITLWTNDNLHAARRIYQRAGFALVKEEKHHSFGHDLVGQFWELKLQ